MLLPILANVLAPILLMIGAGALLQWKFKLDLATLSKLNIYLVVPAFIFDKVSTSTLSWHQMGGVVTITVVQVLTLGLIVWGVGRMLGVSRKTLSAVALAVMLYNSGNYGLPLAELAFPGRDSALGPGHATLTKDGGAVQAFVLMTQNVLGYTLGLTIAAMAHHGGITKSLMYIFRMPVLYTLAAALLARWWLQGDASHRLPVAISKTASYVSDALVPLALATLGAQLATKPRWPRWRPVSMVLVMRLLVGPVQMAALLWGFHVLGVESLDLWGPNGWPAELLILTAAVPTAVTTLLLTLEIGGDAELAADCVFWTTVTSCVTIAGWLVVLRWWFGS
jgi:predicted permease